MVYNYNEYLEYELPDNWCTEYVEDSLLIYNPNGNGAITLSFFNALDKSVSLDEQVSILAKKFIDKNSISMHSHLILFNREGKTILYGTGTTSDSWFIKLWVVAKYPKMAFATYQSEDRNKEIESCDTIIDSFRFTF